MSRLFAGGALTLRAAVASAAWAVSVEAASAVVVVARAVVIRFSWARIRSEAGIGEQRDSDYR